MKVEQAFSDKKRLFDLLLLADEQKDMLDHYLGCGEILILYDGGELRVACVVTDEGEDIHKLKNIATYPESQRKGYGGYLVEFLLRHYSDRRSIMSMGTGDTPHSLSFYWFCGSIPPHRVENFFTDRYDHPICEDEISLRDMVCLKREKL